MPDTFVERNSMRQRKQSFFVLITVMALALLALVALQYYWMSRSYQQQSQLFDATVNRTLQEVVEQLEKAEAVNLLAAKVKPLANTVSIQKKVILRPKKKIKQSKRFQFSIGGANVNVDSLHLDDAIQHFSITMDSSGVQNAQIVINGEGKRDTSKEKKMVFIKEWTGEGLHVNTASSGNVKVITEFFDSIKTVDRQVAVFQDLATEVGRSKRSLKERLDTAQLDTLLKQHLREQGIDLPYVYRLEEQKKDSLIVQKTALSRLPEEDYRVRLFPADYLSAAGYLTISFPGKERYIHQQLMIIAGGSGLLILVIISCFAITILTMLRQKKLSELKTEFINNMTHEFKTPVATIMLASEALKDEEISHNQDRVEQLAGVIYDENQRLGNHVERVLNMAGLEREEFSIRKEQVAIRPLLEEVLKSLKLQLDQRGARVETHLNTCPEIITADRFHLQQVLFNLLDNANKYGGEQPHIRIHAEQDGEQLLMQVIDNGIGMTRDEQKHIFDAFYRVPTGNVHNVKGFGLGLSYVRQIIRLHKGTIKVSSTKGQGTLFEIRLPI